MALAEFRDSHSGSLIAPSEQLPVPYNEPFVSNLVIIVQEMGHMMQKSTLIARNEFHTSPIIAHNYRAMNCVRYATTALVYAKQRWITSRDS